MYGKAPEAEVRGPREHVAIVGQHFAFSDVVSPVVRWTASAVRMKISRARCQFARIFVSRAFTHAAMKYGTELGQGP